MPQKNPTPLALQWLVFIRDHGQDLKLSKEARVLASVLPTYGEGKRIFVSMVTLTKILPMNRETIRKARQELEDKGLLEDITGKPKPEKQERTYRLTMPGYVSLVGREATQQGSVGTLQVVSTSTTPGTPEHHPLVSTSTTPGTPEDHNIKLLDQDLDQAQHHQADDVAERTQPQSQTPGGQAPQTPQEPGRASTVEDSLAPSGDEDGPQPFDWDDPDDGGALAAELGVPVASIGQPFRSWFEGIYQETDITPILYAAHDSADKKNPVGYFKTILPSYDAEFRALGETAFKRKHEGLPPLDQSALVKDDPWVEDDPCDDTPTW